MIAVATQGFLAETRLPAPIGHACWRADLAQPEGAKSETTSYRRCDCDGVISAHLLLEDRARVKDWVP